MDLGPLVVCHQGGGTGWGVCGSGLFRIWVNIQQFVSLTLSFYEQFFCCRQALEKEVETQYSLLLFFTIKSNCLWIVNMSRGVLRVFLCLSMEMNFFSLRIWQIISLFSHLTPCHTSPRYQIMILILCSLYSKWGRTPLILSICK